MESAVPLQDMAGGSILAFCRHGEVRDIFGFGGRVVGLLVPGPCTAPQNDDPPLRPRRRQKPRFLISEQVANMRRPMTRTHAPPHKRPIRAPAHTHSASPAMH